MVGLPPASLAGALRKDLEFHISIDIEGKRQWMNVDNTCAGCYLVLRINLSLFKPSYSDVTFFWNEWWESVRE